MKIIYFINCGYYWANVQRGVLTNIFQAQVKRFKQGINTFNAAHGLLLRTFGIQT